MADTRIADHDERIAEKHEGELHVRGGATVEVLGMITGLVTVEESSRLILRGVAFQLRVMEGGIALVHGMVSGPLRAERGSIVDIFGMVFGPVTADPEALITQRSGSRIEGRLEP